MESEAVEDMAGPLLKPLGVDGAPFSDVGEWLLPFSTADKQTEGRDNVNWVSSFLGAWGASGRSGGTMRAEALISTHCVFKAKHE